MRDHCKKKKNIANTKQKLTIWCRADRATQQNKFWTCEKPQEKWNDGLALKVIAAHNNKSRVDKIIIA